MQAVRSWRNLGGAVAAALCCLATTCHAPVGFEISGSLDSGVRFAVADLTEGNEPVSVKEIVVGQVAGDEMWHLNGRADVRSIVYGQVPEGLQVALGPASLQPGRAYYIVVMGDSGWGREAKGTCRFTLDETGHVQTEPGC